MIKPATESSIDDYVQRIKYLIVDDKPDGFLQIRSVLAVHL